MTSGRLIDGFMADWVMADKVYDINALLELLAERGTAPVIPPRRNRNDQCPYDKQLYKLRHLVENAFLKLKQWRSIATRYAKTTASFLAECQIAVIVLWLH
jgi:transposase